MRVSVSDVDAYRYYLASESMTLDEFLARLRRETPPTPAMAAGTAFHKFLETSGPGELVDATVDGIEFRFDLSADVALPDIRELKATKEYLIDGIAVELVGKVDAMSGYRVWDHKLTSRFDPERYADSFQWRAYLTILGAQRFTYNVFTAYEDEAAGAWIVKGFDSLDFYRYPGMERDVATQLTDFVRFVKKHLPEKAA